MVHQKIENFMVLILSPQNCLFVFGKSGQNYFDE